MQLSLATPESVVFSGDAEDILLNSEKGQINILDMHANLIALVKPGDMTVVSSGKTHAFEVREGVLRVQGETVKVICSEAHKKA